VENIMSSKLFTTRQGTVLLGVIAAVIAAIALIVYLNQYRNSVNKPNVNVLVAQRLIQKGTPGNDLRTTGGYYKLSSIPQKQVESGAIVDPASLAGKVALTDIAGGQQLTAADFGAASGLGLAGQLGGRNERAVVVPLGSPQAVGGQISAGSHVDVWVTSDSQGGTGVSRPIAKLLFQDMKVLNVTGGNVTLQATPTESGQLIYASTNATVWLALRPTIGTTPKPPVISAGQVTGG
jgi:Flp pilus assembly protein CpaB